MRLETTIRIWLVLLRCREGGVSIEHFRLSLRHTLSFALTKTIVSPRLCRGDSLGFDHVRP